VLDTTKPIFLCKIAVSRGVLSVFALAKMATLSLKVTTHRSFTFIFKGIIILSDDLTWRHVNNLWQNNKKSGDTVMKIMLNYRFDK